jgi:hypothetical protein
MIFSSTANFLGFLRFLCSMLAQVGAASARCHAADVLQLLISAGLGRLRVIVENIDGQQQGRVFLGSGFDFLF